MKKILVAFIAITLVYLTGCSVSYKFNDSSIDYNLTKSMNIKDFVNQAPLVYSPLAQMFNEHMKDVFTQNTKLRMVRANGDMEIEGEIVQYDLTPLSVKENALASQTRLTMGVRYRFRNNKAPQSNNNPKEETISAYRDFDSNKNLTSVQDQLAQEMVKEIVDQVFNHTMSNW